MALQKLLVQLEASMALHEELEPPSTMAAAVEAVMPSALGTAASLSPFLSCLAVVMGSSTDQKTPKNCFQDLYGIVGLWTTNNDLVSSFGISVCSEFSGSWYVAAVAVRAIP